MRPLESKLCQKVEKEASKNIWDKIKLVGKKDNRIKQHSDGKHCCLRVKSQS